MTLPAPDHPSHRPEGRRGSIATALAIAAWSGILLQLWLSLRLAHANGKSLVQGLLAYLGYFTVLTNLFVALVLTALSLHGPERRGRLWLHPQIPACAAISIALVGLGYHFLLRHLWNPQGLQWLADLLLHYVVPSGFCLHWLFFLPKPPLPWWSPLAWCAWPGVYFAYALLRGSLLMVYPYPFIDVAAIGYGRVMLNAFGLLAAFLLAGWLFLAVGNAMSRITGHPAARPET